MIAKNVGIRRARGAFILCTNIDILFSDALFRLLADRTFDRTRTIERIDAMCLKTIDPQWSLISSWRGVDKTLSRVWVAIPGTKTSIWNW